MTSRASDSTAAAAGCASTYAQAAGVSTMEQPLPVPKRDALAAAAAAWLMGQAVCSTADSHLLARLLLRKQQGDCVQALANLRLQAGGRARERQVAAQPYQPSVREDCTVYAVHPFRCLQASSHAWWASMWPAPRHLLE